MAADGNTLFDLIKTEAHGEIQGWTKFSRLKMEGAPAPTIFQQVTNQSVKSGQIIDRSRIWLK